MEPSRNRGSHPESSGRSGNSEQHFSKASYSISHWVLRTQMSFASLSGKSNIEHIPSYTPNKAYGEMQKTIFLVMEVCPGSQLHIM